MTKGFPWSIVGWNVGVVVDPCQALSYAVRIDCSRSLRVLKVFVFSRRVQIHIDPPPLEDTYLAIKEKEAQ